MSGLSLYLDYHAHAPLDPTVHAAICSAYRDFDYNAHSASVAGERTRAAVEAAREIVGKLVGFQPTDVIFTSGATEANNLAIKGLASRLREVGRTQIIVSSIEHLSVLMAAEHVGEEFSVIVAPVLQNGLVDLDRLRELVTEKTGLVSIAGANHEIGVVQPIVDIAAIVKPAGAIFHCDLAQIAGKLPLDLSSVDMVSVTAHKLHGPIGVGALCVRRKVRRVMTAAQHGGGQEAGLRAGTLPAPLCIAFGKACEIAAELMDAEIPRVTQLRDELLAKLQTLPGVTLNGDLNHRLPGNINLCIQGVDGEALVMRIKDRVVISTGSACSAHSLEPSHVLLAIGLNRTAAESAIRIGIGRYTTQKDIDVAATVIGQAIRDLRNISMRLRA
ncbi:cysteine desulfurase family protein [Asticcacaulis sp. AC466]|uniref:cysteine desulfurase family protein n=1 Tax=Asticcacaulis sp. AC466 TaxID=1282362 RepID=UPI0003FC57E8|nr:cysteine desulfurase family protein [Asticcacaulis sp. AC466]